MTENTDTSEIHEPFPGAFGGAVFLAPFLCAAPFILISICLDLLGEVYQTEIAIPREIFLPVAIPALAPLLGWPSYLTVGVLAYHLSIRHGFRAPWQLAVAGLTAHIAFMPVPLLVLGDNLFDTDSFAFFYFCSGAVIAPLWSAIFASLYKRMS